MRTTLSIDDDLFPVIRSLASSKQVSLGAAASELIRKGMKSNLHAYPTSNEDDFPVFRVSENAKVITLEDVRCAEEEE
jgi:hypothetical protein